MFNKYMRILIKFIWNGTLMTGGTKILIALLKSISNIK